MFIQNKYTSWYYNIINKAKSENRIKSKETYYESHHIIPKSLGGNNSKENIVLLTAREHYICHCLLVYAIIIKHKKRMVAALSKMQCQNNYTKRNSLNYSLCKKLISGPNNWMYGKTHTEEAKQKISLAAIGNKRRLGGKLSEESKKIISEKAKGNKRRLGGKLSEESKKIISEKNKINSKNFLSKTTKEQRSKLYGSSKGKIWYYDPNTFKRYYGFKETQPAGYIKGFIKNINK